MNSGTRNFFITALVFFGALVATDAGRVGEDGTGAMWVAPELLDALGSEVVGTADLQTNGRVAFEWHPATGELSFATNGVKPAFTLPEELCPEPVNSAIRRYESR